MANTGDCLSGTVTYFSTGAARMLDGFIEAYHRRARQLSVAIFDGALNFSGGKFCFVMIVAYLARIAPNVSPPQHCGWPLIMAPREGAW